MKKILIAIIFCSFSGVFAQKFPVSSISADMKEKAHAVVREHKTMFTVKT